MPEREAVLREVDGIMERCGAGVGQEPRLSDFTGHGDAWLAERGTACLALLERLAGPNSSYRRSAQDILIGSSHSRIRTLAHLVGVVRGFRADVEAGYTRTLTELVHADLFADFTEMPQELVSNGGVL